jgi:hypothetical protein
MSANSLDVSDSTWASGRYFAAFLTSAKLNNVTIISTDGQCVWHRATAAPVIFRNLKITNKSGTAFGADTFGNTAINNKNIFFYNFDISECPTGVAANINNAAIHHPYTIEMSFGFSVLSEIKDDDGNLLNLATCKFYDKDDNLIGTYTQNPEFEPTPTDIIVLTAKHGASGGSVNYFFDTPDVNWTKYYPIKVKVEKAGYETYYDVILPTFSRDNEIIKKGLFLNISMKKQVPVLIGTDGKIAIKVNPKNYGNDRELIINI